MAKKTPKTKVISVRLPIEEREAVEKAAVEAGTTVSAYIADVLRAPKSKRTTSHAEKPLPVVTMPVLADAVVLDELRRIGINLNQIARASNAGVAPDAAQLAKSLGHLLDALADPAAFKRRLEDIKAGIVATAKPAATESSKPIPPVSAPVAPKAIAEPPQPGLPPGLVDDILKSLEERPLVPKPISAPQPRSYDVPPYPDPERNPFSQPNHASVQPEPRLRPAFPQPAPRPPRTPRPLPSVAANPAPPKAAPPTSSGLKNDHPYTPTRYKLQNRNRLHLTRSEQGDEGASRLGLLRKLWNW